MNGAFADAFVGSTFVVGWGQNRDQPSEYKSFYISEKERTIKDRTRGRVGEPSHLGALSEQLTADRICKPDGSRGFWARKATDRQGKQAVFVEVADPSLNAVELSPEWPTAGQGTPAPAPEQHERLKGDPQAYSFYTAGLPRLGLSATESPTFVGINMTFFRKLVDDGTLPRPRVLRSRRLWSTIELSAAFSMLPREGEVREDPDLWANPVA